MPEILKKCVKDVEKDKDINNGWGICINRLKKSKIIAKKGKHWVLTKKGKKREEELYGESKKLTRMVKHLNKKLFSEATTSGGAGAYQQMLNGVETKWSYDGVAKKLSKKKKSKKTNTSTFSARDYFKNLASNLIKENEGYLYKQFVNAVADEIIKSGEHANLLVEQECWNCFGEGKNERVHVGEKITKKVLKRMFPNLTKELEDAYLPTELKMESNMTDNQILEEGYSALQGAGIDIKNKFDACDILRPRVTWSESPNIKFNINGEPLDPKTEEDWVEGEAGCPPVPKKCGVRYMRAADSETRCDLRKMKVKEQLREQRLKKEMLSRLGEFVEKENDNVTCECNRNKLKKEMLSRLGEFVEKENDNVTCECNRNKLKKEMDDAIDYEAIDFESGPDKSIKEEDLITDLGQPMQDTDDYEDADYEDED